jgi:hypothetical protein
MKVVGCSSMGRTVRNVAQVSLLTTRNIVFAIAQYKSTDVGQLLEVAPSHGSFAHTRGRIFAVCVVHVARVWADGDSGQQMERLDHPSGIEQTCTLAHFTMRYVRGVCISALAICVV